MSGQASSAPAAEPTGTADKPGDKETLSRAIGRIASGVYIATVKQAGERHGVMVTWVAQAGFEPPMITLAINKTRPILSAMAPGAMITLNVLSENNMDIFKHFAAPAKPGVDKFAELKLLDEKTAAGPVFADCIGYLNLQVKQHLETGDHTIVLAEVKQGDVMSGTDQPFIHLRKNGLQY